MTATFEEIECKFLDIDSQALEQKLLALGAEKRFKKLFRRQVFDYPDLRLNTDNSWLRVRDEGERVTLSYKQRQGVRTGEQDEGMREIEITVSDFDTTVALLEAIGLKSKFYEENWRLLYELDGVEVAIDSWPLIPPYVEIEGKNWPAVQAVAEKLGFDWSQKAICSTAQVYDHYGIKESDFSVITFERQERK